MDPEPGAKQPPEGDGRGALDRHLAVFFEDPTLWPVLLAALLGLGTAGAAVFLLALADRNLFAMGALGILLWMTVDFLVRRRRVGVAGGFVLALWGTSALAALGFWRLGLF